MRNFSFTALVVLAMGFAAANADAAGTITVDGEVTAATGAFVALTPPGSPIIGGIEFTGVLPVVIGPGDISAIDINVGGFCFSTGIDVSGCPAGGTLIPITSIDSAAVAVDGAGAVSGTLDITSFSPSFGVSIPLVFDFDADSAFADGGALGTATGSVASFVLSDTDGDGVSDDVDNCTLVANADQRDTDGDGFGNICDPDLDNDCLVTTCPGGFFDPSCGLNDPLTDMGIMRLVFFSPDPDADLDGDGVVNPADLGILVGFEGLPPGPSALTNVCQPVPGIDIEKSTNGVDADDPNAGDAPQIAPGSLVTWTYLVTNTGDATLNNVVVTDDQGVAVACPQDTLDPGQSMICTASGLADDLNTTGFTTVPGLCGGIPNVPLYENVGAATGEAFGQFVEDFDPSHYCNPAAMPIDSDGDGVPDSADACPGTDWPDSYPTTGYLGTSRYTLREPPLFDKKEGRVSIPDYTILDTNGCSCDQLVDGGYGVGSERSLKRRGCTRATMENPPPLPPT